MDAKKIILELIYGTSLARSDHYLPSLPYKDFSLTLQEKQPPTQGTQLIKIFVENSMDIHKIPILITIEDSASVSPQQRILVQDFIG